MICEIGDDGICKRHKRKHSQGELVHALADTAVGEQFRKLWDAPPGKNSGDKSKGGPMPVELVGPCRHMDENPLERAGCGSCQAKWVYPCDVHGKCSPEGYHVGVKRCGGCAFRTARESDKAEPNPTYLKLVNEHCPGDVLVMSAAVESLHLTYPGEYVTAYRGTAGAIFEHNPHVVDAVSHIEGKKVEWREIKMEYPLIDKCDERPVHFMHGYCEFLSGALGRPVPLVVNRPFVYLTPDERGWLSQVAEVVGSAIPYWIVNAGHKGDYPAKWWGLTNYQRLVDSLRGKVAFVQMGADEHNHPPLSGVIDLRGKTDTRQFLRLVYHAAGGVGPSTFLQHACAAFEKPYVCIAGGREPLAWQHYPRQATLSTIGVTPCSMSRAGRSCWKDRVTPDAAKPASSVCELPTVSAGGEMVAACVESIRPERVAEEILARFNNRTRMS